MDGRHPIAEPALRADTPDKTSGRAVYVADVTMPGMLHAVVVRSDRPRARILAIDVPPLPEGVFVVGAADVPGRNRVRQIADDQPVFAEGTVNWIGDPVLLVAAPALETAAAIAGAVRIDYEDIPAILTLDDADDPSIPPIVPGNALAAWSHARGDVEGAFARAALVVTDVYRTGRQEQAYLEPQGVIAWPEDGRMHVRGSMQCPYYVKAAVMQALALPAERVRIAADTVGGGFGGKEDHPSLLACQAATAALRAGRPVRLVLDRGEDMETTPKRHPSRIELSFAIDGERRISAVRAKVDLDAGANTGLSGVVLQRALFNISGAYSFPAVSASGRAMATNTVPAGAFRGFGAPQAIFAIEMHMRKAARLLGEDELDFRLRHLARMGDPTATGGTFRDESPMPAIVARLADETAYRVRRDAAEERFGSRPRGIAPPLRGIGLSMFLHGCGFTGSGERDHIHAKVRIRKRADDCAELLVAAADLGQGPSTTLRKIAAEALGLPLEQVFCAAPDTDLVPDSGPTVASRTAMIVGQLVLEAARALRMRWNEPDSPVAEANYRHPPETQWDDARFAGDAYPAYSWGAVAVAVEIDPLTHSVKVTDVRSGFDVGQSLDDRILRGQIEGGLCQGLGYGMMEVMTCRDGRLRQRTLTDYIIPTSEDFPAIGHFLENRPYARGPFGAKGAGELTLIGAAPALAAAVENAAGVAVRTIPVTPEWLTAEMGAAGVRNAPAGMGRIRPDDGAQAATGKETEWKRSSST